MGFPNYVSLALARAWTDSAPQIVETKKCQAGSKTDCGAWLNALTLWCHLKAVRKALSSQLGGREFSRHPYHPLLIFYDIFPPRNFPFNIKKIECLPPGPGLPLWASSAPLSTRVAGTIPQAHHPVGAAQGREGSAGPIDSQLGQAQAASRSAQRLRQPTTPNPGAARSSCQGPAPATMSREYPAHLQAAAPEAPMRHWPMRPHDPRPNTKESSLKSISPMFGSAVQERAMAGVTQGRKSCSCMQVDGNTLAQDPSRMTQGRNITGVPGLAWCRLLLWPGEFG